MEKERDSFHSRLAPLEQTNAALKLRIAEV